MYISAVSESMLLKKTLRASEEKYKESFLIVVSSWNCDLMLMLEHPLSHYWTSPLKNNDINLKSLWLLLLVLSIITVANA